MTTVNQVFLAVPTRGYLNVSCVRALQRLRDLNPGLDPILFEDGHLSVSHVRNMIVKKFLASDKDVLLMVDDDVAANERTLDLLKHEKDIVACPYLIIRQEFNLPIYPTFLWREDKGFIFIPRPFGRKGLVECDALGTGCVAIHRRVFEHPDMKAPFDMAWHEDGTQSMSDDILFCYRAKRAGFQMWVDYDILCDHLPVSLSLNRMYHNYAEAYEIARKRESGERIELPNHWRAKGADQPGHPVLLIGEK